MRNDLSIYLFTKKLIFIFFPSDTQVCYLRRREEKEKRRRGEEEKRRRGEEEKRRRGEEEKRRRGEEKREVK